MEFKTKDGEILQVRPLAAGDAELLKRFGQSLSAASCGLFCPYPWNDNDKLADALNHAVDNSIAKIDASYIILSLNNEAAGHFFLWKAGGNPLSQKFGVEVPELGVAVADNYQGKGLGYQAVAFLQKLAHDSNRDAIELTTALDNHGGWHTYLKAGFEHAGNIFNPLGVDVTEAAEGRAAASSFREERQMIYIINETRRQKILDYLAYKRELAKKQP
jgi:GNAT superfamily N-acetyltransferase